MAKYILLLHENPASFAGVTPAQMQAIIERYSDWGQKLRESGHMHQGVKLGDNGGWHMRRGERGVTVTDGPYAEAKDVIGGLYMIEAENEAEAQQIASGCPHVEQGWIEIRTVDIA
jgi:hypothetical protein